MNTNELNTYIKNYLEHDKTQRAIMITAPWGFGKSYYIKNDLCKFLHDNKLDFAIVSLYGIESLKEINKELFLEIKLRKAHKRFGAWAKTILSGTAVVGKTLLKQLAKVDIDFNIKEPNYEKIYKSIDLKDRLIIFEDLERASIDIVEFLGYVNNLVEQDGVKVLLVANEKEIMQYENAINNGKEEQKLTDKSKKYLKIKEKTICDTINFYSDNYESIKSILEKFNNKYFKSLLQEDKNGDLLLVKKIEEQMLKEQCMNYRSLLFACQKTEDMLNLLDKNKNYNLGFIENLFIGTIIYSIKLNKGDKNVWEDVAYTSNKLGNYTYPFYKIMYDFINLQSFSEKEFESMQDLFINEKSISKANDVLNIIYNYFIESEIEVKNALNKVSDMLKNNNGIRYNDYVRLANYLIAIKSTINYKIDDCLKYMLENIKKAVSKGEEVRVYSSSGIQLINQEQIDDFEEFKKSMRNIIDKNKKDPYGNFDSFSTLYDNVKKDENYFFKKKTFINNFDIDYLLNKLQTSSAKELLDFRIILQSIYAPANISEFFYDDIKKLIQIKERVSEIISKPGNLDKIQLLQLNWLLDNIDEIIKKLQNF